MVKGSRCDTLVGFTAVTSTNALTSSCDQFNPWRHFYVHLVLQVDSGLQTLQYYLEHLLILWSTHFANGCLKILYENHVDLIEKFGFLWFVIQLLGETLQHTYSYWLLRSCQWCCLSLFWCHKTSKTYNFLLPVKINIVTVWLYFVCQNSLNAYRCSLKLNDWFSLKLEVPALPLYLLYQWIMG